jgi:hypothetical protein
MKYFHYSLLVGLHGSQGPDFRGEGFFFLARRASGGGGFCFMLVVARWLAARCRKMLIRKHLHHRAFSRIGLRHTESVHSKRFPLDSLPSGDSFILNGYTCNL